MEDNRSLTMGINPMMYDRLLVGLRAEELKSSHSQFRLNP